MSRWMSCLFSCQQRRLRCGRGDAAMRVRGGDEIAIASRALLPSEHTARLGSRSTQDRFGVSLANDRSTSTPKAMHPFRRTASNRLLYAEGVTFQSPGSGHRGEAVVGGDSRVAHPGSSHPKGTLPRRGFTKKHAVETHRQETRDVRRQGSFV